MAIFRLLYYIRENKDRLVSTVDLVELARSRSRSRGHSSNPLKIIVDFHRWEAYVRAAFMNSLEIRSSNRLVALYGAEYGLIDDYVKQIISNLREVNIELVFYLSSAKGCSDEQNSEDALRPARKAKLLNTQGNTEKCIRVLDGKKSFQVLKPGDIERPVLQEVQNVITLQDAGCEINMCLKGHTELVMAQRLHRDKSVFGVFSSDTDFCIFPDCTLLAEEFFDEGGDLGLGMTDLPTRGPQKLLCGVLHSESLRQILKLKDHAELVEFSIALGNRFTWRPLTKGLSRRPENQISEIIRQFHTVDSCPHFKKALGSSESIREAVRKSRQYYNLHQEDSRHVTVEGDTYPYLIQGIEEGKLPSTLIAMYHGVYFHRCVLEDRGESGITAERALAGLRAYLYSLVLPPNRDQVKEIGLGPSFDVDILHVPKVSGLPIPTLSQVKANSFTCNLRLFELILQHQEQQFLDQKSSYFTVHGHHTGFLCYLLRYFLLMNWGRNLNIAPREFLVLVACLLARYSPERCLRLRIMPSARCVTLHNWFLCLYRTAFAFLGNLLDLNHEFPTPQHLFSGSVWVAFYMASDRNDRNGRQRKDTKDQQWVKEINEQIDIVLADNRRVVKDIVRDLFPV